MSWQDYVDTNLVGSGKLTQATIIGLDGGVWATSSGFNVSHEEGLALIKAFQDPSGIRSNGLYANGKRFIALRTDDRSIYGKLGSTGLACVKTSQCVLIGFYNENIVPGDATTVVEGLADYLISVGY